MPFALIAGTVASNPKIQHFPTSGRPRAEVIIRCDSTIGELFRVMAYDDRIGEFEVLQTGDAVAIQGSIELEYAKNGDGKTSVSGFFVVASQICSLARRSPNKAPVSMARNAFA